jgi:hypothetical protein
VLRAFSGAAIPERTPSQAELIEALEPLILIADKFDCNQLTGMGQKVGCCGPTTVHPECMVLVKDRLGRPLLTVADCLKARAAIGATLSFEDFTIQQSQK